MSTENMPRTGCGDLGERLDAYISGELDAAGRSAVEGHLAHCAACRRDQASIEDLRMRLRSAARAVEAPAEFDARIRGRLAMEIRRPWWSGSGLAIAAGLVVAIGLGVVYQSRSARFHDLDGPARLAFIERITRNLYATVGLGVKQHLHCYIARNPAAIEAHLDLPAAWKPLPEKLKPIVPARFELLMAHMCQWRDRTFAHLAYRDGEKRISLLITPKVAGDELPLAAALPALEREGIAMFGQNAGEYHVTAFEVRGHIAYVVSDDDERTTQSLARAVAPAVGEALAVSF